MNCTKLKRSIHIELVGDIAVELVECFETQCEGQINLPQEQGETMCSLEADRDEVSPVRPYEVELLHDVKEHMPSFGGIEAPGSRGLTQVPDVIVPECVPEGKYRANNMECTSAREEMGHGPTQTGVVGNVTDLVILETAPAPRDAACEVRSVFCEWPKLARSCDRNPAPKRSALGTRPEHGRLKCRQLSCEFGKHMAQWEHVYRGQRAACHGWNSREESEGRHRSVHVRGGPRGVGRVQVTLAGISEHEWQVSSAWRLTWAIAQKRALNVINGAT